MTQSISQLLAGATTETRDRNAESDRARRALWSQAVAAAQAEFKDAKTYRVTLCQMVFSEVDVVGPLLGIERLAEQHIGSARVVMSCAPSAMKIQVKHRGEWCEVEWAPVDPMDHESPWAWQMRKPKTPASSPPPVP